MENISHSYLINGISGSGKSYFANEIAKYIVKSKSETETGKIKRVVFSETMTHDSFWGGYRPTMVREKISYEFVSGPFADLVSEAMDNLQKNYCLIIEEINRCDAYSVLGKLFQLLDRDESGESSYKITLPEYEVNTKDESGKVLFKDEKLSLPPNFYIIATTNAEAITSFKLDTAFNRRFRTIYMIEGKAYGCPEFKFIQELKDYIVSNDDFIDGGKYDEYRKELNRNLSSSSEDKALSVNFYKLHAKYEAPETSQDGGWKIEGNETGLYRTEFIINILAYIMDNVRDGKNIVKQFLDESKDIKGLTLEGELRDDFSLNDLLELLKK